MGDLENPKFRQTNRDWLNEIKKRGVIGNALGDMEVLCALDSFLTKCDDYSLCLEAYNYLGTQVMGLSPEEDEPLTPELLAQFKETGSWVNCDSEEI